MKVRVSDADLNNCFIFLSVRKIQSKIPASTKTELPKP
jgi:hypothetical protein